MRIDGSVYRNPLTNVPGAKGTSQSYVKSSIVDVTNEDIIRALTKVNPLPAEIINGWMKFLYVGSVLYLDCISWLC